jgi:hypothetical protein
MPVKVFNWVKQAKFLLLITIIYLNKTCQQNGGVLAQEYP